MSALITAPPNSIAGSLITEDNQIEWRGLLMGPGTYFGYKRLTGWRDLPKFDTNFTGRPRAHGARAGNMYANEKIITFETQLYPGSDPALTREVLRALENVTPPLDVDSPLVVREFGETHVSFGRITGRAMPKQRDYMQGFPRVTLQWTMADPRRYGLELKRAVANAPQFEGGLPWEPGLDWNPGLDWGESTNATFAVTENDGNAVAPFVAIVQGPLTGPFRLQSSEGWTISVDRTLTATDRVVINTLEGTLMLNGISTLRPLGQDTVAIDDAYIPQGVGNIALITDSSSDTGFVEIQYRDTSF